MFSSILDFFFPHGFMIPGFLENSGGGSVGGGPDAASPSGPAPPFPVIAGPVQDLSAQEVPFNASFTVSGTSSNNPLFENAGLVRVCQNFASAILSTSLSAFVTITPTNATSAVTYASGWIAVMPTATTGQTYPTSIASVSGLPGAVQVVASMLASGTGVLEIPPGIQRDVLVSQVIGRNPVIVSAWVNSNVSSIQLVIRGKVRRSGAGYHSGFF